MPPPVTDVAAALAFPFELVRTDLERVEAAIISQGKSFDPAIEGYITYVCRTSGKRIRPALALLAGGATGAISDDHRKLGLILELVHVASLVHDDIMDGAELRRSQPTAVAKWGSSLSVLLGDVLFAHALELSAEYDDNAISRAVARASRDVCAGEILQTQRRFDLNLSVPDYLRMIEMKTAALFAAATHLGARLSGASEAVSEAMRNYGLRLGCAYQIYDDCLDLVGDEAVAGKTLRTDLARGKLTLPVLYLLEQATDVQKTKLNRMLLNGEPMDTTILASIADYEGAIERAVQFARSLLQQARQDLLCLSAGDHASALSGITVYLDKLLDKCRAVV